ncbi:ANKRD44 [Symbiodinium sp. CCMP2456]|nr:ANKRD44 [Symbiodinium sp. CCMP2456]
MEPSDGIRVFGLSGNLLATLDHKRLLAAGDFADVLKNDLQRETGVPGCRQRLFWGETEVSSATCPWGDTALPVNLQLVIMPLRHDKTRELRTATASGKLEFVQRLLTEGQDPNSPGEGAEMPLHIAADRRRLAIAAALTQAGADPNVVSPLDGATPLSAAAAHGNLRIVQHLLQAHASLDLPGSNGRTPLIMATIHGHLGVVEHLVEEHADVDKPGVGQAALTNPLWSAAECNHSRIVATLLRARADVDWNNPDGRTPLWCAVANGSIQSARYLLKAGASVNCTDQHGDAPLWVAVACGQPEAVECLIAALSDVNQLAGNGQSPLCTAALRCDLPAVRRLLRAGADERDWQGRSPADLAISTEVKKELHKHGPKMLPRDQHGERPRLKLSKDGSAKRSPGSARSDVQIAKAAKH